MGKNVRKNYNEQEKAIKEGKVSFDLNIYFIGEKVSIIYEKLKKEKSNEKCGLQSYWNYIYHEGDYNSQLKIIAEAFNKKLQ